MEITNPNSLNDRARRLRELHDEMIVLPNAWDAASARMIAHAGAAAVATTSAGVAWALGVPDGQHLTRAEMLDAVRRIAGAVDLPVTADAERGYGDKPEDVAVTVTELVAAGAVGMNLEDSLAHEGPLREAAEQAARIAAAREAAAAAGVPDFVINARTDVYLSEVGDPAGRPAEVLARAAAYQAAGAGSFFVPRLLDLDILRQITSGTPLPVNVMARPGGPTVAQLREAGVRRVSLAAFVMLGAYTTAHQIAATLLTEGTHDAFPDLSEAGAALARW